MKPLRTRWASGRLLSMWSSSLAGIWLPWSGAGSIATTSAGPTTYQSPLTNWPARTGLSNVQVTPYCETQRLRGKSSVFGVAGAFCSVKTTATRLPAASAAIAFLLYGSTSLAGQTAAEQAKTMARPAGSNLAAAVIFLIGCNSDSARDGRNKTPPGMNGQAPACNSQRK